MRLKCHRTRERVHTELLDDLEDVKLLIKLTTSSCVQEVVTLAFWPTTAAAFLVKTVHEPKAAVGVIEDLA